MSDMVDLEVQMIHRAKAIAILSDGQEIQITNWIDVEGDECGHADAVACACGPDSKGKWYAVNLGSFTGAVIQ
jgi:hypothetical protein